MYNTTSIGRKTHNVIQIDNKLCTDILNNYTHY